MLLSSVAAVKKIATRGVVVSVNFEVLSVCLLFGFSLHLAHINVCLLACVNRVFTWQEAQ